MSTEDWQDSSSRALGALFGGETGDEFVALSGYPEFDSTFLMLMNAHDHELDFVLPRAAAFNRWELVFDTSQAQTNAPGTVWAASNRYRMQPRSVSLFTAQPL
jgi:pullulanase/glycogen debranching enzyme